MLEEINLGYFLEDVVLAGQNEKQHVTGSQGQELRTAGLYSRSKSSNQGGKEEWKDNSEREGADRTVKGVW